MDNNVNYTGVAVLDVIDHETGETRQIIANNILTLGGQFTILNSLVYDRHWKLRYAIFGDGTATLAITNTIGTMTNNFSTTLLSYGYPASPDAASMTLSASWNLSTLQYNGNTIKEVGLLGANFNDNSEQFLFCRITLSEADHIVKTSNISINGAWYITVTESAGA